MRRTSSAVSRAATRAAAVAVLAAAATLLPARPAAPAPAPVEAGSGLGSATVAAATIVYGGYHLTLALGDSDASYQASAAQATSQGVSLPALAAGATGGAGGSCPGGGGGVPAPTAGPPFTPLTLDSGGGAQHKTSGNLPFGTEEASVALTPLSASATTSAVGLKLPGLVEFSGSSSASSSYQSGTQRTAVARSATDLTLLGGLVGLSGLEWNATHQTGQATASKATFDVAAVRVGLTKLPLASPADVASALSVVNKTLAPTGLEIDWPKISETPQTASVDGLTLRIKGSQLLNTLLQPVMQLMRALGQLLAPIFNSATGCGFDQLASAVGAGQLVADVLVGVLAGGGEIDLSIGGASAGTEPPPAYVNPFGNGGTQPHPPAPVPGTTTAAAQPGSSLPAPAPAPAAVLPNPGTLPKPQPSNAPVAAQDAPQSVAYRLACISTNAAGPQHCSPGARALGLSSLVILALAVFAADLYQGRRRRPLPRRRVL